MNDGNMNQKGQIRNSNIEWLKIISMLLIVTCHVVTEIRNGAYVGFNEFVYDWTIPHAGIRNVWMAFIHQMGLLGNTVFFVCSAWFLLDSNIINTKKIIAIMLDIEVISVLFLGVAFVISSGNIDKPLAVQMLFPHTFRLFWYLTCYIIFYFIHPTLNDIVQRMSQRSLIRTVLASSIVFIIYAFFTQWFFSSVLISWVVLYFLVAYVKKYLVVFQKNIKLNILIVIIGLMGSFAIPLMLNYVKNDTVLSQYDNISSWNPFHVIIAIALVNIAFMRKPVTQECVNYVSSLSFLIFVFHSNRISRCYIMPYIWEKIYVHFGYNYIIISAYLFGIAYFLLSAVMSAVYQASIQRFTKKLSYVIYRWISRCWNRLEVLLIKLK